MKDKLTFQNPILAGFYPDPSICKAGDDFYLINSTFAYFPGIPVFHSRDLVSWNQIGNVLDRPGQVDFTGLGVSRAIFAPAIRHHEGIFYITCTVIDGIGNFVVTAKDPAGPWSDPVKLPEILGIDPSLFFDDDGKCYIIYNSDPPDNKSLYDGHRTIRINEFDYKNLKASKENKILINGGVDITKKPVWIEGPHIFKVKGKYFLSAAEGGTSENHSQVIFRSDSVSGPYIPYEKNPILTQRHLDPKRKNPVTCTGHADYVELDDGNWWSIFLGCRPYPPVEKNDYNTGRETFLAPIRWIDGWPVINPDHDEVMYEYPLPMKISGESRIPLNGNFSIIENFDGSQLDKYWLFLRTSGEKWYSLSDRKGFLKIDVRPETVTDRLTPSFIGRRQQHINCSINLSMDFTPKTENEKSGGILFQDERYFYYFCKSIHNNEEAVELYKSKKINDSNDMELVERAMISSSSTLYMMIKINGGDISFHYSLKKDEWILFKDGVDATLLSTKTAGGFVGTIIAMYATSLGSESSNSAYYDWFEYKGNDETFN